MKLRVLALGAGQDVGRSCVVVRLGKRTIMFDCGMHMGYNDSRRFPDFTLIDRTGRWTAAVDAVLITHFHLDHVGALPYFVGVCGYDGPVVMTHPTAAIAPLMLEDYHKVLVERPGLGPVFSHQNIGDAMARVTTIDLQQVLQLGDDFEVTSYYAGHVLGAAMFHVRVGAESVLYTGDYNTTAERHLASACVPRLAPDLMISESTYATTVRQPKAVRERELLEDVAGCLKGGGKVLVPVFAVGRAQELLMLLDDFWTQRGLQYPIYFSGTMATRANAYYRLLLNWGAERVKLPDARASAFGFARVLPWDPGLVEAKGPCVLFATPGMLHGGTSLEVFKAWAPSAANLVLLPSYQVAGTLGRRLLAGQTKGVQLDRGSCIDVNCRVRYVPFSAHADAKGILQLITQVAPAAVVLVHGEPDKMEFMATKVSRSLGVQCYCPANGEEVVVPTRGLVSAPTAATLLRPRSDGAVPAGCRATGLSTAAAAASGVSAAGRVPAATGADMGGTPGSGPAVELPPTAVLVQQLESLARRESEGVLLDCILVARLPQAPLPTDTQQAPPPHPPPPHPPPHLPPPQPPPGQPPPPQPPPVDPPPQAPPPYAYTSQAAPPGPGHPGQLTSPHLPPQALAPQTLPPETLPLAHLPQPQQGRPLPAAHQQAQVPPQQGLPSNPAATQTVSLQLLPAQQAAAALGVTPHRIRLSCRVQVPASTALEAALQAAHHALSTGLPQHTARALTTSTLSDGGGTLRLRSIEVACSAAPGQGAAVGLGAAASPAPWRGLLCRWQLEDDRLAQRCVTLLHQAMAAAGVDAGRAHAGGGQHAP